MMDHQSNPETVPYRHWSHQIFYQAGHVLRSIWEKLAHRRLFGGMGAVLVSVLALAMLMPVPASAETPKSINMKLLLIAADGNEPVLSGMKATLDQIGVPYDVLIAATTPFDAQTLSDGAGAGRYQGIILTTGNLGYNSGGNFVSAFSAPQWQALWDYEAAFKVRQATLYTYPSGAPDNYGLNLYSGVDTTSSPLSVNVTEAGKTVFSYLNAANPITITNAWAYLAKPMTSTNPVPLLQTTDGFAIASIYSYTDGRSNLTITADGNPYLVHSMALGYGIVNWVTKGVFLGARKVYMNPQPDDVLIDDVLWNTQLNTVDGPSFRMSGSDLTKLVAWQKDVRSRHPTAASLILEMPFNGAGANGLYANDTLTPAVKSLQGNFRWINHTYTHANLDYISYSDALAEINKNTKMANTLGLAVYSKKTMIQPEISGLQNPDFLRAAVDTGIRFILSDTSRTGWDNPTPNTGFVSTIQPSILILPRRPTNLYFNVSTPDEWVSEYNHFYAPGGVFPYWDRPLTYPEIIDKESSMMLSHLLKYDVDSLMFHQSNLYSYNGTNSLLGDLIEATLAKYEQLFKLPIVFPSQLDTGNIMAARMAYNASGARATLVLGSPNKITLATTNAATIPVTGVLYGRDTESYGGQNLSNVKLSASQVVTMPGPAW
ncbi:MAG: Agd3-related carbohydrate deacetylase [Methylomonas sp.]